MTQSSYFLTNGSSLEDCHTSFFDLADLCGIKWRTYFSDVHSNELVEDPVLHSYSRCINANILCVWRRVRNTRNQNQRNGHDSNYVSYTKELWIFWYGEAPDFSELIVSNLKLKDELDGSWESGLSYECRTLLFKALHTLIEKCLLSKGFSRLGKWFFQVKQAQDAAAKGRSDKPNDDTVVTFTFNFFLHGDSTVCSNIDGQQHSNVYMISSEDLHAAQSTPEGLRVILAPYGLQAYLTGHVYKDSDQSVQKFLADWKKIYPLNLKNSKENGGLNISSPFNSLSDDKKVLSEDDYLNKVVEIIIGDCKMKYPFCYVFITEIDRKMYQLRPQKTDPAAKSFNPHETLAQLYKQSEESLENCQLMVSYNQQLPSDSYCLKSNTNQTITQCDSILLDKVSSTRDDGSSEFANTSINGELLLKKSCNCPKCQQSNLKKQLKSSNGINGLSSSYNQFSGKSKDRSFEKERAKQLKNCPPFHKRAELSLKPDEEFIISSTSSLMQSQTSVSSPVNSNVNMSSSSLNQSSATPIIMSYKSPVSTSTSSILNTPGIESSPLSNFNCDAGEHTSPLTSKEESASINTPVTLSSQLNQSPKDKSGLSSSLSPAVDHATLGNTVDNLNGGGKSVEHSAMPDNADSGAKSEATMVTSQIAGPFAENASEKCALPLKRPFLYRNVYDGEHDLRHGLLYDFRCESDQSWQLPMPKNRRINENSLNNGFMLDLNGRDYADFNPFINSIHELPHFKSKDPYFFNSSGDESNDNFQAPLTPKNSNGPHTVPHIPDSDSYVSNSINELSRMFPTPPSLEAMQASPGNNNNSHIVSAESKNEGAAQEPADKSKEQSAPKPVVEELRDFSFVYKPPVQSSFITSTNYAPLESVDCRQSLPSHCFYKHNTSKKQQQQTVKSFGLGSSQNQSQLIPSLMAGKSKFMQGVKGLGGFPGQMIRNVRPPGQNMPGFGASGFINRPRPPLGMQSQMYNFPSDNFGGNFRQNSPGMSMDGSSMSPITPGFISSPLPNFDNRKSPYSFHQTMSHNSPSNSNAFMSNSPLNTFNSMQQKSTMSPMVGSSNFFNMNMGSSNAMESSMNTAAASAPHNEVNALMLNLLLSDSMFNLFRDHNFESCSICVCNMNIKGNDVGIYLHDPSPQPDYYPCSCGFSALSNRHLSQFSGLFYEDEVEITGVYYDPSEKAILSENSADNNGLFDKDLTKAFSEVDDNLIDLVISMSTTIYPSSSTFAKIINCFRRPELKSFNLKENSMRLFERDSLKLVYKDCTDVVLQSMVMTRSDAAANVKPNLLLTNNLQNLSVNNSSRPVLHDWSFRHSKYAVNNHEVIYLLKTLQPLLQEAVQRKGSATGSEVTYNSVKGPLTWRQFHRLAGRGSGEYQCEPQPIPSLLAGYDNDCVVVSPFALKFWEKLSLEPYAMTRDVGYIALVPDNEYIISKAKSFLNDLSTTYEVLRFGDHFPIRKVCKDGIYVVGQNAVKKSDSVPLDEWFSTLGESNLATKIKHYAQACCNLAPNLSVYERSLFEAPSTSKSFSEVPNSANAFSGNASNTSMNGGMSNSSFMSSSSSSIIVIYIIDPFTSSGKEASRLGCIGLLKSFANMLKFIPENVRNNVHVQLLSIDSIISEDRDFRNATRNSQMKELAFSVFSQCKQQLVFQPNIKSLTGLGPAASFEVFLKGKDKLYNSTQLYTSPFILAPLKDKQTELGEMFGDRREKSQILFCCYCISEDQKWLLVSCTNDRGDILQSKMINVHVPNRTRRKNATVRRFGLNKLMNFVQTVMSESVLPWRLVVGRLGRIGHGELKDWTSLLSKKSLQKYSRQLRDLCSQCHDLGPHDQPAIYSACLISLEADTALRVFPNYYTPDERFSSSCNTCGLSTPEDASCTHILVFPTSATTQSSHANFNMDIGANLPEEFDFGNLDDSDIPVEDDFDLDNFWDVPFDDEPRRDEPAPGSPGNRQQFGSQSLKNSNPLDDQDEPAQLLQQPLALAFYVSTARTGPLPRWFWTNSPHLENSCPVFLKSALLIHTPFVQQNTDDLLHSNNRDCHSLDSSLTTDVLRCVLEGYNSLSWLALDSSTNDRLSCLPLHIQVLMQLYHSVQALI
ncbi:Mediator of RNA polymerase II transcription subunit 13-like [Tyrophagus putrescentiae]|nr:Mediator of RNA polymerase II transcription subunit 13-like [Tyrophagus putrescentiae]